MENQELIKQVTEKAEKWLTPAYDAETQAEVKRMLENDDKTELIEAFYKDLEFGTGGLRGIMGVGSNRMNIYTVRAEAIKFILTMVFIIIAIKWLFVINFIAFFVGFLLALVLNNIIPLILNKI